MSRFILLLKYMLLFGGLLLIACESMPEKKDYLVKVGDQFLDREIFARRYKLTKDFSESAQIDPADIKSFIERHFLQQFLFRAEGFRLKLDEQQEIQEQIVRSEKELFANPGGGLFRDLTQDVQISEAEIRQLYDDMKYEVKFAHILVGSRSLADSLSDLLLKGAEFNTLVERHSLDMNTNLSNGVIPQYVHRGMYAPALEAAIFDVEAGGFSKPVKSEIGYQVIRVIDRRLSQKRSFNIERAELATRLRQAKISKRYRDYLADLKERYNYRIDKAAVALVTSTYRNYSGKSKLLANKLQAQQLDDPLLTYDGQTVTVGDLLRKYNQTPIRLRGSLRSEQDIEELFAKEVRSHLTYKDAVARGLDQVPAHQKKLSHIIANIVQRVCMEELVYSQVTVSEHELQEHYSATRSKYDQRSFTSVRNLVQNSLLNAKKARRIDQVAAELRERHDVVYNDKVIESLASELNILK